MHKKPVGIIPARGGSKRFPRKNVALLAGKPLLIYAVEVALESGVFEHVCVSSDDDDILELARGCGAVPLKREPELASDQAQVRQVVAALLKRFKEQRQEYDTFGVMLTTNPLRRAQDIRDAYELFRRRDANCLMTLVPFSHPPQRAVWAPAGYVVPYFGKDHMRPAQALDALYRHDGTLILGRTDAFLSNPEFYGEKVLPYFVPPEYSVDIDGPLDLAWAEFLLTQRGEMKTAAGRASG